MYKVNEKIISFIPFEELEIEAQQQIRNTAGLPFIYKHIAVMPDSHYGKGSTIGTVMATKGAIVPSCVGVDIGCGMISVKTNLKGTDIFDDPVDLKMLREGIERRIPMSKGKYNEKVSSSAMKRINELSAMLEGVDLTKKFGGSGWSTQLGTLGGGNHFIELCLDEEGTVWVTLHSGSRGVGNKIGMHYIKVAQDMMKLMHVKLPDPDLAYLPEGTPEFNEYLKYLKWAQHFALLNREEMMDRVLKELRYHVFGEDKGNIEVERINCHHNFTQIENHFGENVWITRKGAIQADVGRMGMIPGSMGTKSYIVSGLGNKASFNSAPHGAGRRMSRNKAKEMFNMEDLAKSMEGIEYRISDVLVDEIPQAYKDIDKTIEYAKDLVKVEHELKQFLNCKGD